MYNKYKREQLIFKECIEIDYLTVSSYGMYLFILSIESSFDVNKNKKYVIILSEEKDSCTHIFQYDTLGNLQFSV